MRKGDRRKQEILEAAERVFCRKGYEAASIQDILDECCISKGCFYHHFEAKEELPASICAAHAEKSVADAAELLHGTDRITERINLLFRSMIPLKPSEASFMAVLLPILCKPEGRSLRVFCQDALLDAYLPLLQRESAAAVSTGILFPPADGLTKSVLMLLNHCWQEGAEAMLAAITAGQDCPALQLREILNRYRRSMELLLGAPFGMLEIIPLKDWLQTDALLRKALQQIPE